MNNQNDSFLEDKDFSSLVKKARRKSLTKNILISIIVFIGLFFTLYLLGSIVMQKKIDKESWKDGAWQRIIGANVENTGTLYHYEPFTATGTTHFRKRVGGVPVPWGSEERVFTIFGTTQLIVTETPSASGKIDDERIPIYFHEKRMIEFFHPAIDYKQLFDERPLLDEIDEHKFVEFAFSFDKPYSIQEVQETFSDHLAWYWVDTFSPNELDRSDSETMTIMGDGAIGFQHSGSPDFDPALDFMTWIEWLMENGGNEQKGAEELYTDITGNASATFSPSDLKIIGVVVTGTPDELKVYNDVPFIKAAILGATVDKY